MSGDYNSFSLFIAAIIRNLQYICPRKFNMRIAMQAAISADIVSSTSLSPKEIVMLQAKINETIIMLEERYEGFWGRLVKGDYIECVVPEPNAALRAALLLKTAVKSLNISKDSRTQQFRKYGMRLAIGLADMRLVDRKKDIMDGDAIYYSGRSVDSMHSENKCSFVVVGKNKEYSMLLTTITTLVDSILNGATRRQSEVFYYKLLSMKESDIASLLSITQSGVNQRASVAGWSCLETAVNCFEQINFSRI